MSKFSTTRRAGGFSLIEVLVAVVILSFGLLALASLQMALVRASTETKAQSQALALGKEKLEDLRTFTTLAGYQALVSDTTGDTTSIGGVSFGRTWTVTRYVFNKDVNGNGILNESGDSGFQCATAAACTLPGNVTGWVANNEFKVINVNTTWNDSNGAAQVITLTDATGAISPGDSATLSKAPTTTAARRIPVVIANPASDTMVIPIAVGNNSSTAATNPKPLVVINSNTVETQFEVLTYAAIAGDNNNVTAQQRVETRMVGCTCDYSQAPAANLNMYGKRPTYWDGTRYAVPVAAEFKVPAGINSTDVGGQSVQCDICCRDHSDPVGAKGAAFSPLRSTRVNNVVTAIHPHFLSNVVGATPVTSGRYREACRLIRVDGQWRVAADLNAEHFAQLATQGYTEGVAASNTGFYARTPIPDSTATTNYQAFVIDYLDARFTNAASTAFNDPSLVSVSTIETTRNLNAPSTIPLPTKAGTLYQKTVTGITNASPGVVTYTNPSVAQALQLLADGDRVTFAGVGGMTAVNNNGYIIAGRTATNFQLSGTDTRPAAYGTYTSGGVATVDHAKWGHSRAVYVDYLEPDAVTAVENAKTDCVSQTGSVFSQCVLKVLPFTSINLTEIADWQTSNTDLGIVTNNDYSQSLNFSDPVRGKVTIVTGAADGSPVNVLSISRKQNTSLLDLSFDSISPVDDQKYTDAQAFQISNLGAVVVPGGGKFWVGWSIARVAGYYTSYITGTQPSVSCGWNTNSDGAHANKYECNVTNQTTLPPAGLTTNGTMSIVVGGYNQPSTPSTVTASIANCTDSDAGGGSPLTYDPLAQNPKESYSRLNCNSYTVTSSPAGTYSVSPAPNINGSFQSETTTIGLNPLAAGAGISLTFAGPTVTNPTPTCTYTCSKSSCSASGNQVTFTVNPGVCQ